MMAFPPQRLYVESGNGVCLHMPGFSENWYSSPFTPICRQGRGHDGPHESHVKTSHSSKVVEVYEWEEGGEVVVYHYSQLR